MVNNQVQQPPINPVPVSKKPNQWIIAAVILVVIVVIGSIFTLLLSSQRTTSRPPSSISPTAPSQLSPTQDETANWKTYTNKKYDITLKYPPDISYSPYTDILGGTFYEGTTNTQIVRLEAFSYDCGVTTDITLVNAEKAAQCHCDATGVGGSISCNAPSEEKVTLLNGINVFNFILNESLNSKFTKTRGPYAVIFFPKPISYDIGVIFEVLNKNSISKVDQILSTFKFTSALPTGGDQGDQVVCAQDVKECPDGSYVSRQPPSCAFAPCPQNR